MPVDSSSGNDGHLCPVCGGLIAEGEDCLSCARTEAATGPPPEVPESIPEEIAGFKIIKELGHGGMGTVFEAFDPRMQRYVALKILSRHISSAEKSATRFAREAWLAGKLSHPNLVKVFEQGTWQDLRYYTMELVAGGSLFDVIQKMDRRGRDESLGLEFGSSDYVSWALTQIIAAARGLEQAHRQGIVHRDIKPMNLLLDVELGTVKIADFGLALDVEATRLTTAGNVMGTAAYMAPEQIRGESDRIGTQTDVYALGVTLFELLTLELPFEGDTQQLYISAVLTSEVRSPGKLNARVSRDLELVLRKALEKDPRDRYASAGEMADDLENVLHFRPVQARPASTLSRILKWSRRKPMHAALSAALILGLPTVGILTVLNVRQQHSLEQVRIQETFQRARSLIKGMKLAEAVVPLSEVLETDPDHVEALRGRSLSRLLLAQREENETASHRHAEGALTDLSHLVELLPDRSWPHRMRATSLRFLGRDQEAEEDAEISRRLRGSTPDTSEMEMEAILAFQRGNPQETERILSQVLAREPGHVIGRAWRAMAYERLDQMDKARTDYEILSALSPEDAFPSFRLGRLHVALGDLDAAVTSYQRGLESHPEDSSLHEGLAEALVLRGRGRVNQEQRKEALADLQEAESHARRAVELSPGLPWPHLNLGASLMEQFRLLEAPDPDLMTEAIAENQIALELWQTQGGEAAGNALTSALVNQCDALIQLGDLQRALQTCREVIGLRPDDPDNYYNLAGVHAQMGRVDEALVALEKDFELGDHDHEYLSSDEWFADLRDDPRFLSLIERMKQAAD